MLDAVAGIVLGSFTEAAAPLPLPLGLRVLLDADAGTLTLRQDLLR